jgi:hypothetical protein
LYYCQSDATEGVAVADNPEGPFKNLGVINIANHDFIDPAVFVDDDGQGYYYWGQFKAKGAKIHPDMRTLDEGSILENILSEEEHGFHEGFSLRKRHGLYYAVYTDISRGKATCLSYATAKSPLGPFVKGGVIIDNDGCDPETWNNHGSICEFHGQWYVFYHRSSQNSRTNRRVCVEKISFRDDGSISEVEMTSQGAEGPLPASNKIEACRACRLQGRAYVAPHHDTEKVTMIHNGNVLEYRNLDFGQGMTGFEITAASATHGGLVKILVDGTVVGECRITRTGGFNKFHKFTCSIQKTTGAHRVSLQASGTGYRLMDILEFRFL